ncbi:PAS domain S-box protein [Mucilaginibacter sp. KACC 22063]|uniref:PAS domain S-box protein n=1 Tax=Mucilaginibacter sp. KACC 22063 TaxID=3025666 RepID=UPI0023673F0B|nr:PAS domain S-box protein [Mucilaginibacter sp. KACC 22063]WDF55925.1 PAS domain S-box protein [Mucilaginibacter sp. KACC 22063]
MVEHNPVPANEKERLEALNSYDILDTLPEKQYDAIVRLASYICEVPLAFISFIDRDRQWFKSKQGLDVDAIPRADSFCRFTIMSDILVEVPDTTKHNIFSGSQIVIDEPNIRFYASAPLIDPEGHHLGSLCVFDTKPKTLNNSQRDALTTLAEEVISHLTIRKQKKELEATLQWHKEFYNLFNSSPEIHCITDKDLNILFINKAVTGILGYQPQQAIGQPIWKYFPDEKRVEILKLMRSDASRYNRSFQIETPITLPDHSDVRFVSWSVVAHGEKWYASGRDITENKRIGEELEMLSLAASKVNNGIVISNSDDKVVWANSGFKDITGYSLTDVYNQRLRDILKGKVANKTLEEKLDEDIKYKRSYEVELQMHRKDGTPIWVSIINSIVRDADGNVDKQIRVVIDITERKRIEQDVEILSSAARRSPSGILIRDKDMRIVWMNEALETITGYSLEEMRGETFSDKLVGPQTDTKILQAAIQARENNRPYEIEVNLYKKDGTPVWVFLSNSPYFNETGQLERQIMVAVDITERKLAEQQLTTLSLVASNTTSGVVINNGEGEVEWVNQAFEKITGYNCDDVYGKHLGDVLKGELTDVSIIEKSRQLSRNKQSFDVDLLVYRKDGKPLWVSVINSVILDAEGKVDKYIEVIIDISAKKKTEIELISAKEEALQLSRAKDMFISVMSHEIRTPLNAVIGISHLLIDEKTNDAQDENLKILKFSAENLLTLINDVLDFAKIETGNVELEKANINLRDLIGSVIASMQYRTGNKTIYLKEHIDADVPQLIVGDKTRLTQILMNLISNAVKFTEEGGVTVDIKVIEQSQKDVRIRFAITDTGIGIAKDKQSTIFESFKQAEADITRKYGGTGLGLAITKRLIELHDSRINIDSVPGKGSTFWFTITFPKVEENGINNNYQVETGLNLHALVVDDNQINRLLINKVLKKWGATADFAENGAEAIDKIDTNKNYDVVLMDIHMPVMGGLEAAQKIRSNQGNYYQNLPIIALTASMLNNQMDQIGRAGMNDYVLKPFDPKALFDKLSKYQKQ